MQSTKQRSLTFINEKQTPIEDLSDITVLYCRLSQDDGQQGDSNSIINQKAILEKYAVERKLPNPIFFVDDGISGTTFKRPGFQKAIGLVEAGKVKHFIVKDMSRFGRDYLKVGFYTEVLFPEMEVRFIAINDGVDSSQGDNDFTPFRNIINEWYARDTSKKIKAVMKSKGLAGKKLCTNPPYGYIKDPNDKNHWIIDEEAAEVVRKIFQYCIAGHGPMQIAKILTFEKVLIPTAHLQKKGIRTTNKTAKDTYKWSQETIIKMLSRMDYLGHTVNFKTHTKSYKNKKKLFNDKEDYAIFPNTQEAIIDQETFDKVQAIRKGKRRNTKTGKVGLFSGVAYCPDCGKKHYYCAAKSLTKEQEFYVCAGFHTINKTCNDAHYIRLVVLEELVLKDIKRITSYVMQYEDEFVKMAMEHSQSEQLREMSKSQQLLTKSIDRVKELDRIIKRLYEDNVCGKLSDERFMKLSKDYEVEQKGMHDLIAQLQKTISEHEEKTVNIQQFVARVKKYTDISELTPTIVNELIDRVEIHSPDKNSGKRTQKVDIYYSFVGMIGKIETKKQQAI